MLGKRVSKKLMHKKNKNSNAKSGDQEQVLISSDASCKKSRYYV